MFLLVTIQTCSLLSGCCPSWPFLSKGRNKPMLKLKLIGLGEADLRHYMDHFISLIRDILKH